MSAQLTAGIAKVVGAMVKDKAELDLATANQVAGALAKNFKVKPDEVAILRLVGDGRHLEFVVPEKLSKIGSLPLSSTNARPSGSQSPAINRARCSVRPARLSGAETVTPESVSRVTKWNWRWLP